MNRFVAGFFGTPTMNFVEGTLEGSGDGIVFKAKGLEQAIPSGSGVGNGGRSATLGVRSEHVLVGEGANQGKVTITQPLGDITLVFFDFGGEATLAAQVSPDLAFSPGDDITFRFEESGFHMFDGESGERLN